MSGFKGFTFGKNDEHVGKKGDRWKGETGNTYRFTFIMWPGLEDGKPDLDAEGPDFRGAMTHYIEKVGYIVNQGPEYTKLAGSPPRSRIGTAIIVWPTDKDGNIIPEKVSAGECDVKAWLFSDDKYKSLKMNHKEFHFGSHDVTVVCSDTQYQKLTFSPCKENLFRKFFDSDTPKGKEISAKILKDAQEVAANINNEIGREMTLDQVRQKISGGGGSGPATTGSPDMAVTGDIDDLVGGILDD